MFHALPDELIDKQLELDCYAFLHTGAPMPVTLMNVLLMREFGWTPEELAGLSEENLRVVLTCLRTTARYEAYCDDISGRKRNYTIKITQSIPHQTAESVVKEPPHASYQEKRTRC